MRTTPFVFFFQAEDGIRDLTVTGVQTCALPISITYTISYSNTGTADATGVAITDTVPTNTTFVSATGGGSFAAGTVTWNLGNLPASASGSVQLVVQVVTPLANGTVITNGTYAIDSNETAPTSGPAGTTTVNSTA